MGESNQPQIFACISVTALISLFQRFVVPAWEKQDGCAEELDGASTPMPECVSVTSLISL